MATSQHIHGRARTVATSVGLVALFFQVGSFAHAAEVAPLDLELPDIETFGQSAAENKTADDLQLANVVLTASKTVTTVQEAPAIVTIVTSSDIENHGLRTLNEAMSRVPGWLDYSAEHHLFDAPIVRGASQSSLLLHDGVSAFDPMMNIASFHRVVPMELVKRIEVVTGPGGVLWGANSYLGIINLITKDVEDVRGTELRAGYGSGPGDRGVFRVYALSGYSLLAKRLKILTHFSYENYGGPQYTMPRHVFSTALPQPNSLYQYAPAVSTDYPRSFIAQSNGKVSYGGFSLYWHVPFSSRKFGLGFTGNVIQQNYSGTNAVPSNPADPNSPLVCPSGLTPELDDQCYDPQKRARKTELNWIDRYAILEYAGAFAKNRVSLNAKGYFYQFKREFSQLTILPPSALVPGGLSFAVDVNAYRTGSQADINVQLSRRLSLVTGGEAFYEWAPTSIATFNGPNDLHKLPLPCPRVVDPNDPSRFLIQGEPGTTGPRCPIPFNFGADRIVLAAFANTQLRARPGLTFDGGVRVQAAPGGDELVNRSTSGLHRRGYPTQLLFSAAAVWRVSSGAHLKLNYAEGFRPPVFNNTDSNGEAVEIGGSPDLEVERSRAVTTELNARLLRNHRSVRELSVRLDYSFSRLDNLIQITNGSRYSNAGRRDIHTVEMLGKLALVGGHSMDLSYSFMKSISEDRGQFRSTPEHWLTMASAWNTGKWLDLNTSVRIMGAFEDPNRYVDTDAYDPILKNPLIIQPTDLVFDRIPPQAQVGVGLRLKRTGIRGLTVKADAYNVFNHQAAMTDVFYDFTPRLEILPNPTDRFRFFAYADYKY